MKAKHFVVLEQDAVWFVRNGVHVRRNGKRWRETVFALARKRAVGYVFSMLPSVTCIIEQ